MDQLNLKNNNKKDWETAINIFKDRIEGRYFEQIKVLDLNTNRIVGLYSGFAIMSITCLLIETLEQFWQGNIQTSKNKVKLTNKKSWLNCKSKTVEINSDAYFYFTFFQKSEILKSFFDTPEKAYVFYVKIRCGLLHQGQTKGKSLIHIRKGEPVLRWINEKDINEGLSIHRRKFLIEIEAIYNKYLSELEKDGNQNFRIKTLVKKMNYIVQQK